MTTPTITIIDVATSGFNPTADTILEVAAILVDAATLDVLDTTTLVVHHPEGSVHAPDFHEALLVECSDPDRNSMAAVEGQLLAGPWTTSEVICNRALDFDLKFFSKQMPTFARALVKGSQPLELKALDVLHRARGGAAYVSDFPRTYRAVDDAIAALVELRYLLTGGRQ
jgi:oligoribonuclease (3'-5' exoribonuclease)